VYKMVFAAGSELHGSTQPFLLGGTDDTQDPRLAATLKDYILSFVSTLDPNEDTLNSQRPRWPIYGTRRASNGPTDHSRFTVLSVNQSVISIDRDPDTSKSCDFFRSHSSIIRN
jgi:hypothetical protein